MDALPGFPSQRYSLGDAVGGYVLDGISPQVLGSGGEQAPVRSLQPAIFDP